ncbi:MAG: hypothetical protein KAG61_09695 [Bacteriovoracaceae bacterium]|nr:hypothetical protein [Bacteriovoracaceae bacterium]
MINNREIIDHIVDRVRTESNSELKFIAISGQGGVGKSTLGNALAKKLLAPIITLDHYRLPRSQRAPGIYGSHPKGNDLIRLKGDIEKLRLKKEIIPPFFVRESGEVIDGKTISTSSICIFDGEMAAFKECVDLFDFHIYIESDWRTQLNTRLSRDIEERGMDLKKVLSIFMRSNLEDHPKYCLEGKKSADVLLYCNENFNLEIKK